MLSNNGRSHQHFRRHFVWRLSVRVTSSGKAKKCLKLQTSWRGVIDIATPHSSRHPRGWWTDTDHHQMYESNQLLPVNSGRPRLELTCILYTVTCMIHKIKQRQQLPTSTTVGVVIIPPQPQQTKKCCHYVVVDARSKRYKCYSVIERHHLDRLQMDRWFPRNLFYNHSSVNCWKYNNILVNKITMACHTCHIFEINTRKFTS